MSTKHKWKAGFSCKVPCEVAVERLEHLRASSDDGRIDPARVVDDARPKNSALHNCFEWSDKVAAEKHRENQARQLLRSVEIVRTDDQGKREKSVAYVSVCPPFTEGAGYTRTEEALGDPTSRDLVLGLAWSQLQAWHKRWGRLAEFAQVVVAIEQTAEPVA